MILMVFVHIFESIHEERSRKQGTDLNVSCYSMMNGKQIRVVETCNI